MNDRTTTGAAPPTDQDAPNPDKTAVTLCVCGRLATGFDASLDRAACERCAALDVRETVPEPDEVIRLDAVDDERDVRADGGFMEGPTEEPPCPVRAEVYRNAAHEPRTVEVEIRTGHGCRSKDVFRARYAMDGSTAVFDRVIGQRGFSAREDFHAIGRADEYVAELPFVQAVDALSDDFGGESDE